MSTNMTLKDVLRELAGLEEPTMREANERLGDDHGVNLTHLSCAREATQDAA